MLRVYLSLLSVIALAGCAVVDLAAHGVKKYEKGKQPPAQEQAVVAPAAGSTPIREAEAEYRPVDAVSPPSGGAIRSQSLD